MKNLFRIIVPFLFWCVWVHPQTSQWHHFGLFRTNCMVSFNGQMLVGTTEGIFAIDQKKLTAQKKYLVREELNVVDMFKVGDSKLWCLTTDRLLFVERDKVFEYPLPKNVELMKGQYTQICEGYNKKLYIGTTSGFFKGDSSGMEFCNSNDFASREVGVKEILSHPSGKIVVHFGSSDAQDWVLTHSKAGEFVLIEEKGADPLKLIDNVLYLAMDSKANLYLASHNPYQHPQPGTPEKLNYVANKKVFEGKVINILPVSAKLGQNPPSYSSDHSVTKLDANYRLISQEYCHFLFFIQFIEVDNKDKLLKYEGVGDCGGRSVNYNGAIYDDQNQPWYYSERPIVRYGSTEKPGNDVRLITRKPYLSSPLQLTGDFSSPTSVTGNGESVFYLKECFLGSYSQVGWQYFDFEHLGRFYKVTTTKKGHTSAIAGALGPCDTRYFGVNIIDLSRKLPHDGISEATTISTIDSEGRIYSLSMRSQDNYTNSGYLEAVLSLYDGHSWRKKGDIRLYGELILFEEVFKGQLLAVSQQSVFLYKSGRWLNLSDKLPDRKGNIFKATYIPDQKIILAGTNGLIEIQNDLSVREIQYPSELGKLQEVNLLEYDAGGELWLSSDRKLFRLRPSGWTDHSTQTVIDYSRGINISYFSMYIPKEPPQAAFISDKANGTFISSLGGTYRYSDGKWELISKEIFGYLAFDHRGNLMIFHEKGVSLFNGKGVML